MNERNEKIAKTAVSVLSVLSLVIFAVIATGIASAQIAPPTIMKTATPTNINIAGSGVDEDVL